MNQDDPYNKSWIPDETIWEAWLRAWATIGRRHANRCADERQLAGIFHRGEA